jgi:hypothetical protein
LRDRIADMLVLPGFQTAEILSDRKAPLPAASAASSEYRLLLTGRARRYLRDHAPRMGPERERFGNRFSAERRVLAHREEFIRTARYRRRIASNCGEVLTGQHCSHCGQRARVRVLSLVGHDEGRAGRRPRLGPRVWRTLRPLDIKPGLRTQDYLRGRRASYTPPFRAA